MHDDAFLAAILDDPDDALPRLVYADWLEDQGLVDRAELIRHLCRWWHEGIHNRDRVSALLSNLNREWLGDWTGRLRWQLTGPASPLLVLPASAYARHPHIARRLAPLVHRLRLYDVGPSLDRLLASSLPGVSWLSLAHEKIGGQQISRLCQWPGLARLSTLDFRSTEIGTGAGRALADSPFLTRLRRLDLSGTSFNEYGISALAETSGWPALRCLLLNGIDFRGVRADRLVAASFLPHLTTLELRSARLTIYELRILLQALEPSAALRNLDLSNNTLSPRGAESLADSPLLGQFTSLSLARNQLTGEGVRALADSPAAGQLVSLNLASNGLVADALKRLLDSPHLRSLRRLDLSQNSIGLGINLALSPADRLLVGQIQAFCRDRFLDLSTNGIRGQFRQALEPLSPNLRL
jgi:uncharacterized protein (TIGR02996 family)